MPPIISVGEPARITRALPGEPEATNVALKPLARDSMATKTPTVPAMPIMATMVDVQRAGCCEGYRKPAPLPRKGASKPAMIPKAMTRTSRRAKIATTVIKNPKKQFRQHSQDLS